MLFRYRVKAFLALPNGYMIPHFVVRFRLFRGGFAYDSLWKWIKFFLFDFQNLKAWAKEGLLGGWEVRVFVYALCFRFSAALSVFAGVWIIANEQSVIVHPVLLIIVALLSLNAERFMRRMLRLARIDGRYDRWERENVCAHMPAG